MVDAGMADVYKGSCLCSAITYELLVRPKAVSHCHCGQCRKAHGAMFASYGSVPREALRISSGATDISAYASSASVLREFCGRCGSTLFWSRSQGAFSDWVSVALATLDTPFEASKHKHVHVSDEPLWYWRALDITSDTPTPD